MDEFGEDRPELSGSLITMEFGEAGKVVSLWASDPVLPDEGQDFQFVLPPLPIGEDKAEDHYPGTILLGIRTNPDDPWSFSRNSGAKQVFGFEEELGIEIGEVQFEYEFPMINELSVTGKFYEQTGPIPQIIWEVEIRNSGRVTVEIGELGFPLAFNTFYDGFGWSDEQLQRLWQSRLYVHKFIGGAGSWVFAQRMTSEPPGLLVFPMDDKGWEFYASIPNSISTPHQWEGIPVVYAYSRATIDREQWSNWWNEHSSLILEPGDSQTFRMAFLPTDRDRHDGIGAALVASGRPSIRLLPSAVAPVDVGIGIEVQGVEPKRFFVSKEAETQIDTDEDGGFCFVRPKEPGGVRVTIEDKLGRLTHVHLMFTAPIEHLIRKRAEYIATKQVVINESSPLHSAITMIDTVTGEQVVDPDEFSGASGIESSLADAVFLAEKNAHYPLTSEIQVLERYIEEFLLDDVQNPGDMSVGSVLADGSGLGAYTGRPLTYPSVFSLYHAMFRIAGTYGETKRLPEQYLRFAARTACAMFRFGWRNYVRSVGILGYARCYQLLQDLRTAGLDSEFEELQKFVDEKAEEICRLQYPYAGESVLDTSGFEEVFMAALQTNSDEHIERTMRCAFAVRSTAPSWWWYGGDKRNGDGNDSAPLQALLDRGEACLAHTTIPNALMFFEYLDRDYMAIPETYMRLSFAGMMGPWALIRKDGAASMCYCPDRSSKHFGYNRFTGASGLGYFHYLRLVGSYVFPAGNQGIFTFGCHFESEGGAYSVRPWDGVGRKVILRQFGAEFHLSFGKLALVRLDQRKRWFELRIENPCDKDIHAELTVMGMWGSRLLVGGRIVEAPEGVARFNVLLPAGQLTKVEGKVEEV